MSRLYFAPLQSHHHSDSARNISRSCEFVETTALSTAASEEMRHDVPSQGFLASYDSSVAAHKNGVSVIQSSPNEAAELLKHREQKVKAIEKRERATLPILERKKDATKKYKDFFNMEYKEIENDPIVTPGVLQRSNEKHAKYISDAVEYNTSITDPGEFRYMTGMDVSYASSFDFQENDVPLNFFVSGTARMKWVDAFTTALFMDKQSHSLFYQGYPEKYTISLQLTSCIAPQQGKVTLLGTYNDKLHANGDAVISVDEEHNIYFYQDKVSQFTQNDAIVVMTSECVHNPRTGILRLLYCDGEEIGRAFHLVSDISEFTVAQRISLGSTDNQYNLGIGFRQYKLDHATNTGVLTNSTGLFTNNWDINGYRLSCIRDRLFLKAVFATPYPIYKVEVDGVVRSALLELAYHKHPNFQKQVINTKEYKTIQMIEKAFAMPSLSDREKQLLPVGKFYATECSEVQFLYHKISADRANVLVVCQNPESRGNVLPEFPLHNGRTEFGYCLPVFNVNIGLLATELALPQDKSQSSQFPILFEIHTGITYEEYIISLQSWTEEQLQWVYKTALFDQSTFYDYPYGVFCGMKQKEAKLVPWMLQLGYFEACIIDLEVTQVLTITESKNIQEALQEWKETTYSLIETEQFDNSVFQLVDKLDSRLNSLLKKCTDLVAWDTVPNAEAISLSSVKQGDLEFPHVTNLSFLPFISEGNGREAENLEEPPTASCIPLVIQTSKDVQQTMRSLRDILIGLDKSSTGVYENPGKLAHISCALIVNTLLNTALLPRADGNDVYATFTNHEEVEELLQVIADVSLKLYALSDTKFGQYGPYVFIGLHILAVIGDRLSFLKLVDTHPSLLAYQASIYRLNTGYLLQDTQYQSFEIPALQVARSSIVAYYHARQVSDKCTLFHEQHMGKHLMNLFSSISDAMNLQNLNVYTDDVTKPVRNALLPYMLTLIPQDKRILTSFVHSWRPSISGTQVSVYFEGKGMKGAAVLSPHGVNAEILDTTTPQCLADAYFNKAHEHMRVPPTPPRLLTERDILHFTKMNVLNELFGSERDSEQFLLYLAQPYTRIPLIMDFQAQGSRLSQLKHAEMTDLITAILFQPGVCMADTTDCPSLVPFKENCITKHGYLINELVHAPQVLFQSFEKLLLTALKQDTGVIFAPVAEVLLFLGKTQSIVLDYAREVVKHNTFFSVSDVNVASIQAYISKFEKLSDESLIPTYLAWLRFEYNIVHTTTDMEVLSATTARNENVLVEHALEKISTDKSVDQFVLDSMSVYNATDERDNPHQDMQSHDPEENTKLHSAVSAMIQRELRESESTECGSLPFYSDHQVSEHRLREICKVVYPVVLDLLPVKDSSSLSAVLGMHLFFKRLHVQPLRTLLGMTRNQDFYINMLEKLSIPERNQVLNTAANISSSKHMPNLCINNTNTHVIQWSRISETKHRGRYCQVSSTTDTVCFKHIGSSLVLDLQLNKLSPGMTLTYDDEEYNDTLFQWCNKIQGGGHFFCSWNDMELAHLSDGIKYDWYNNKHQNRSEFYCALSHAIALHPIYGAQTTNYGYTDPAIAWCMPLLSEVTEGDLKGSLFFPNDLSGLENHVYALNIIYARGKIAQAYLQSFYKDRQYVEMYVLYFVYNQQLASKFVACNNTLRAMNNTHLKPYYERVFGSDTSYSAHSLAVENVRMIRSTDCLQNLSGSTETVLPDGIFKGILPLKFVEDHYFCLNEQKQIVGYSSSMKDGDPFKYLVHTDGTTIRTVERIPLTTEEKLRLGISAEMVEEGEHQYTDQSLFLVNTQAVLDTPESPLALLVMKQLRLDTIGRICIWVNQCNEVTYIQCERCEFVRAGDRFVLVSSPSHYLSLSSPSAAELALLTQYPELVLLSSDETRSLCLANNSAMPTEVSKYIDYTFELGMFELHEASMSLHPMDVQSTMMLFFYHLYQKNTYKAVSLIYALPTATVSNISTRQPMNPAYLGAVLLLLHHISPGSHDIFPLLVQYIGSNMSDIQLPFSIELALLRLFITPGILEIVRNVLYSKKNCKIVMALAMMYNRLCYLESFLSHQKEALYLPLTSYQAFPPYKYSQKYIGKYLDRFLGDMAQFLHSKASETIMKTKNTQKTDLLPYIIHDGCIYEDMMLLLPLFKDMFTMFPKPAKLTEHVNSLAYQYSGSLLPCDTQTYLHCDLIDTPAGKVNSYSVGVNVHDMMRVLSGRSSFIYMWGLNKQPIKELTKRYQLSFVHSEANTYKYCPLIFIAHFMTVMPEFAKYMCQSTTEIDKMCRSGAALIMSLYIHRRDIFDKMTAPPARTSMFKKKPTSYKIQKDVDTEIKVRDMLCEKRYTEDASLWNSPLLECGVEPYISRTRIQCNTSANADGVKHPKVNGKPLLLRLQEDQSQMSTEKEVVELKDFTMELITRACTDDSSQLTHLRHVACSLRLNMQLNLDKSRVQVNEHIATAMKYANTVVHTEHVELQTRRQYAPITFEYLLSCLTSSVGVYDILKRNKLGSVSNASLALESTATAAAMGCRCSLLWRSVRALLALEAKLSETILDPTDVYVQACEIANLFVSKRTYITTETSIQAIPCKSKFIDDTRMESNLMCPVMHRDKHRMEVLRLARARGETDIYDFFTSDSYHYKYMNSVDFNQYQEDVNTSYHNIISYDPRFLVFEYLNGILLRQDQITTTLSFVKALYANDSATQQLLMGAGKTTVVMPLLAILLFRQPTVLVVPAALLSFTKNAISSAFASTFNISQYSFDFNRNSLPRMMMFRDLYYHMHHGGVITTVPAAIQSLQLKSIETDRALSLTHLYRDRVAPICAFLLHALVRFFRTCNVLVDEVDTVLHPLRSELNFPIGMKKPLHLAPNRWELGMHMLHPQVYFQSEVIPSNFQNAPKAVELLQSIKTAFEAGLPSGKVQLQPHLVVTYQPYYVEVLRPLFAKWAYMWLFSFGVYHLKEDSFLAYINTENTSLDTQNDTHNELNALVKSWLQYLLPHLLSKVNRMNYGLQNSDDLVSMVQLEPYMPLSRVVLAVPFVALDTPSRAAEYSHPDMLIGYTFMSYVYEGLRYRDFCRIVKELRIQADKEVGVYKNRETVQLFASWLFGGHIKDISLEFLIPSNIKDMHIAYTTLRKNSSVISWYLGTVIFPEYTQQQELKLCTGAADMPLMAKAIAGFSGTPSSILPIKMGHCQYQKGAEAAMYTTLTTNSAIVTTEVLDFHWNAHSILKHIATAVHSNGTPVYRALIDSGALITGLSATQVAEYLLEQGLEWAEAVVYTDDAGDVLIYQRGKGYAIPLHMSGVPLTARFTFYDQAHSTGVDVKHVPTAHAAVTVNSSMVWRDYVQAVYRMRAIGKGQTVTVFIPPTTYLLLCETVIQDKIGKLKYEATELESLLLTASQDSQTMLQGLFLLFLVNAVTQEDLQSFQMDKLNAQYTGKCETLKQMYYDHLYTYKNLPMEAELYATHKMQSEEKQQQELTTLIATAKLKKQKIIRRKLSSEYKEKQKLAKWLDKVCLQLETMVYSCADFMNTLSEEISQSQLVECVSRFVLVTDTRVGNSVDAHEQDMEITTEMEQAKQKEVVVEQQQVEQVGDYTYTITSITKSNASEMLWDISVLGKPQDSKDTHIMYPVRDLHLLNNVATQLNVPHNMLLTNNVYTRRIEGAHKLGNIHYVLEWSPDAHNVGYSQFDTSTCSDLVPSLSSSKLQNILQGCTHPDSTYSNSRCYLYLTNSEGASVRALLHQNRIPTNASIRLYTLTSDSDILIEEDTSNHQSCTSVQEQQLAFMKWLNGIQTLSLDESRHILALLEQTSPAARCAFHQVASACRRKTLLLPLAMKRTLMYTLQYSNRAEVHVSLCLASIQYQYCIHHNLVGLDFLRILDHNLDGSYTAGNISNFFKQLNVPVLTEHIACLLYAQGKYIGGLTELSGIQNSILDHATSCVDITDTLIDRCLEDDLVDSTVVEMITQRQQWITDAAALVSTFETIVVVDNVISIGTESSVQASAVTNTGDVLVVKKEQDDDVVDDAAGETADLEDSTNITYNEYGWRVYTGTFSSPLPYFSDIKVYDVTRDIGNELTIVGPHHYRTSANGSSSLELPPGSYITTEAIAGSVLQGNILLVTKVTDAQIISLQGVHPLIALQQRQRGTASINATRTLIACPDSQLHYDYNIYQKKAYHSATQAIALTQSLHTWNVISYAWTYSAATGYVMNVKIGSNTQTITSTTSDASKNIPHPDVTKPLLLCGDDKYTTDAAGNLNVKYIVLAAKEIPTRVTSRFVQAQQLADSWVCDCCARLNIDLFNTRERCLACKYYKAPEAYYSGSVVCAKCHTVENGAYCSMCASLTISGDALETYRQTMLAEEKVVIRNHRAKYQLLANKYWTKNATLVFDKTKNNEYFEDMVQYTRDLLHNAKPMIVKRARLDRESNTTKKKEEGLDRFITMLLWLKEYGVEAV